MIKIEVDGPSGKNGVEIKGFGAQLLTEAQIALALLLIEFEKTGISIEQAAKWIGGDLDKTIEGLKRIKEREKL